LGGASYPTSKPHLSINPFFGPWDCCEVRCELENNSPLFLTSNTSSSSSTILATQAPNPTPEKENSKMTIGPPPASRRHYEMNNRSDFQTMNPASLTHVKLTHQNYPRIWSELELGPSKLLVDLSIAASRLWTECGKITTANRCPVPSWLGYQFWLRKAQGEGRRFEKTRAEPERMWSDGFLSVNFLGRWVWLGRRLLRFSKEIYIMMLTNVFYTYTCKKRDCGLIVIMNPTPKFARMTEQVLGNSLRIYYNC
jgi:hypothetical protein